MCRAQFETATLSERGGASAGYANGVCKRLGIPCMNLSTFYEYFATVNIKQLANNKHSGYVISPCILYDENHAYIGYDPRSKWKTISAIDVLEKALVH